MKTKIKRHSRSVLSVILAISMLISTMMVGIIATDAAKVTDDEAVGWSSSTDYFHYQINNGGWQKAYFSTGGKTTFTVSSSDANATIEFELNFNGTVYKRHSSQQGFTAAGIRSTSGTTRLAKTDGTRTYSVTGVYADTYTVQLNGTPSNGEQSFTVSGTNTGSCSNDQTYIVIGEKHLTNTDTWQNTVAGATARNIMVYDSEAKMYKLEYSNIAKSTSGFKFRITTPGNWDSDKGYPRSNLKDPENIATTANSSDNNSIRMTLSQAANITIYFDDSKTDTSSITLEVTPAVSTVTAAVSPASSGTATVNNGATASGIAYGGSVTLVATAAANYHFDHWSSTNNKLIFADTDTTTTTATVYGTDTATANFTPDTFSIVKQNTNCTITAPNTAQYTSSVSVSATAASGYAVNSIWYSTDGGTTKTTIANASSGSFTMPASNVTVGAVVDKLGSGTITFGVNNASYGYVSVGKQYGSTQNQIEESYTSPKADVIQGTMVNFCAIPAKGYNFVGWYTDSACTDGNKASNDLFSTGNQTTKDVTVEMPNADVTLYAKFEADTNVATSGIRIFVNKANNKAKKVWIWNTTSPDFSSSGTYNDRPKLEDFTGAGKSEVTINNVVYYKLDFPNSSKINFRLGDAGDSMTASSEGTYTITDYSAGAMSAYSSDAATTDVYPVFLEVTNPDKDSSGAGTSTYAPAYATKSTAFTVNHTPDGDHKATVAVTGYTNLSAGANSSSTKMSSSYAAANKVTVTYANYEYYPVTFSSGPNGTVTAKAGGETITSGTMVKEGTTVVFTATPNSNYKFDSWSSDTPSGTDAGSGTDPRTRTVSNLSGAANAKAYFKYFNDGTQHGSGGPYFVINTNNNYRSWGSVGSRYYYKDGRAFAYVDNFTLDQYYYFTISDTNDPSTDEANGYGKGCNSWGTSPTEHDLNCVTDFDEYVDAGVGQYDYYDKGTYKGTAYLGQFKVTDSAVKRIIIDLGPCGNDGTYSFDNNFRVIPVYDTDATNVDIYAKDGSYRGNDWYDFFPGIANTVLTGASNIKHHANFDTGAATRGTEITVTTTIDSEYRSKYYVKGFSFNGITPQLYEHSSDGVYTCSYTIPADFLYDYLEITPIYYIKDADAVEFYIENYDEAFQATGWGNTLSVYPYYFVSGKSDVKTSDNAFGGYPGQPVINYGGRRFIQIPTSYTMDRRERAGNDSNYPPLNSTAIIKGMTLSNDYWDIVHREYVNEVDTHLQTYDYDDFYKIYRETTDQQEVNATATNGRKKTADQITFAFKYRTSKDNFGTDRYSNNKTMPATITKSDFSNGWDEYLDYHDRPIDVFGKQLTAEEQAQDPLLIVSNGYEYTHAGYYATLWTIYTPTGTKIGTISPSALEISSQSRLMNRTIYPNSSGRNDVPSSVVMKQLGDFETVYQTLKSNYAGVPALITYEKQLSNDTGQTYYTDWGERSNRSDGRWYYSYMNEKINASLRIEYSNNNGATYTVDSYKSGTNKGSVTGATVQFTNHSGDADGPYELYGLKDTMDYDGDVLSNLNHYYKFAASAAPGYIFAGWWFERDGIVTNVNEDLSKFDGKSQMTSNAVFVARYVKAPTGTLTVNHTLTENSVGQGTTWVAVKAINTSNGDETWLTGAGMDADHFTENQYAVDSTYVGYKKGYDFEIILKTVTTNQFTEFDRFSSAPDKSADYFSTANQATEGTVTTTSFTVSGDDLFAFNNKGFPEQQFDTLTYYSKLKSATYTYQLDYSYPSYDNLYGTQGYSVKGTFSYDELNEYMTISNNELTFVNPTKKVNYLEKNAPYEDNFMQTISWLSSTATESFADGKLTVTISPDVSTSKDINLTFVFPYAHDTFANKFAPILTEGKVLMKDDDNVPINTNPMPQYNEVFSFSDVKTFGGETDPDVLEAPAEIYSDDTRYVFRYWTVTSVPDAKHSAVEYTRGYSQKFNLVLFQDAVVKPIYTEAANDNDTVNPKGSQKADSSMGVIISFIENSRNQYNYSQSHNLNGSQGTKTISNDRSVQGDRIYTDFLLSYNNIALNSQGEPIQLNTLASGTKKAGLIVETVGDIDIADGKYTTKTEMQYKETYGGTLNEISTKLSGKDSQGQVITVDRDADLKAFIANHSSNLDGNLLISEFDVTELDNKNRVQFYYSLPNKSHSTFNDTTRRFKVYRAYAYICDANHTNIQISQTPVYFTIYDIGSIQSYAEASQTGGYKS